jgi:hypothetical protein
MTERDILPALIKQYYAKRTGAAAHCAFTAAVGAQKRAVCDAAYNTMEHSACHRCENVSVTQPLGDQNKYKIALVQKLKQP